jgi:hypothetical protein
MQFGGGGTPPVGVLFDGTFDRVSDLLALAVLYGLESKGESRVVAVSVSRPDFPAAQYADIVKRYYAPGGFGGAGLPVGVAEGTPQTQPIYEKLLAKNGADGTLLYKPAMKTFIDSGDPATVLRNALTASQPKNSIVVASGSLNTVSRLLELRGSKLLIESIVRHLVIADPKVSADAAERANAQRLFDEWPTPIFLCGADIGDAVRYPAASIESDFTAQKANPVVEAYRAFGEMPYDAPTAPLDAALFAVRSTANLFKQSEPGNFRVSPSGAVEFVAAPNGKHRRLIFDEAQKENVVKTLTQLASLPPRPQGGGRRGGRGDANAVPPPPIKK